LSAAINAEQKISHSLVSFWFGNGYRSSREQRAGKLQIEKEDCNL
jgi:hypothetical protein